MLERNMNKFLVKALNKRSSKESPLLAVFEVKLPVAAREANENAVQRGLIVCHNPFTPLRALPIWGENLG